MAQVTVIGRQPMLRIDGEPTVRDINLTCAEVAQRLGVDHTDVVVIGFLASRIAGAAGSPVTFETGYVQEMVRRLRRSGDEGDDEQGAPVPATPPPQPAGGGHAEPPPENLSSDETPEDPGV